MQNASPLVLFLRFHLLVVLCCAGCATSAKYEGVLQSWIDRSAEDLVKEWGYPDDQLTAPNGNMVYVYRRASVASTPGFYRGHYHYYGGRRYPLYDPGFISEFQCTTFLEVDKRGRIVRWEWRGNDCVALTDTVTTDERRVSSD